LKSFVSQPASTLTTHLICPLYPSTRHATMIAQLTPSTPPPFLPGYALPPVPHNATRILLLRHGRSTLNDEGRYQGSADLGELTHRGFVASQAMGRYLRDCPIDAVYVSPLKRAQDTAAALLPHLKNPVVKRLVTSDLLKEIHLPAWEGLQYDEVRSRQADLHHCWQHTPDQLVMPRSRTSDPDAPPFYPLHDLYDRVRRFWRSTLPHHGGQTILIVSHGSTNQALINTALHLPAQQHHALQQTHSGLTILDFAHQADRAAQLHCLNVTLSDRLPKLKAGKQGLRLLLWPSQSTGITPATVVPFLRGETLQAVIVEEQSPHSADADSVTRALTSRLLPHHPETVLLPIQQLPRSDRWPVAIQKSLAHDDHNQLTTLLIVAPAATLQARLRSLLQLPNLPNLTMQTNYLSVIHYAKCQPQPILQGFNLLP
jgi:probable phosphoglycerate mutase